MKSIIFGLTFLFTVSAFGQSCDHLVYGGKKPVVSEKIAFLCKGEFAIGYSRQRKTAIYVLQFLDPEKLTSPSVIDSPSFRVDPSIARDEQASLQDYVGSGFDRGHLAPFEDNNHDLQAAINSMMLTNIVPQNASNNRGIWRVLESKTRNQSLDANLFVITGPIYSDEPEMLAGRIPIPQKLYKVIINTKLKTVESYIIPNMAIPSSRLPEFLTTLKEVRRQAGFDPLPITNLTEVK